MKSNPNIHRRNNMKSILRVLTVLVPMALAFGAMDASASSFTKALTKDYFKLATVQYYYSHDRFAVKARAADKGKNVLPDNPSKVKKLRRKKARKDLQAGYKRLMAALNGGFRKQNPKMASRAQTKFDCWLWAVAEKDTRCIDKCRKAFLKALAAYKAPMMAKKPAPKPMAKPAPRSFIVFFDWDKSNIRSDARKVLKAAAAYAKKSGLGRVRLVGHADRSGKSGYNMGLSKRRSAAVSATLVKLGLRSRGISMSAKGESSPMVGTKDGVREPRNRRVEINLSR
jgi:OOP family OmpA-OmpF porin